MVGLFLLLDAWFRLRPKDGASEADVYAYHHVRHWAILLIWGAPFLLAPPIFSHDAYSYAAQGWLVHNNINPYEAGPAVLPGAFRRPGLLGLARHPGPLRAARAAVAAPDSLT
jgi:alpha-1,6-mannosyltransferase